MTAETTLRARYLAAAAEIDEVYRDTNAAIGYDGRQRMRKAYATLQELGTYIPDVLPGWLPYGDMPEADIAKALQHAEHDLASPETTLRLIGQVRALREQLTALHGARGVTEDDIRSMLAEGFATAWRKAADNPESVVIMKLIKDMDEEVWGDVINFVANPLIAMLRAAEARTAGQEDPA